MRKTNEKKIAITAKSIGEFLAELERTGLLAELSKHDPNALINAVLEPMQFCASLYPDKDYDTSHGAFEERGIKPVTLPRDRGFLLSCEIPFTDLKRLVEGWQAPCPKTVTIDICTCNDTGTGNTRRDPSR